MHMAVTALLIFIFQILVVFNTEFRQTVGEFNNTPQGFNNTPQGIEGPLGLRNVEGLPIDPATLPFFQTQELGFIYALTVAVILLVTLINSLVPRFASGGHHLKCVFFGSLMLIISGFNLTVIPTVVIRLFAI
jgi:archaellum biogenesis protein FlaJ (TadC family)